MWGGAGAAARTPEGSCGVNSEGAEPSPEVRSLAMYRIVVERVWVRVCAVRRWLGGVTCEAKCVWGGEKRLSNPIAVLY